MATIHDFWRAGITPRQTHYWTRICYLKPDNQDCGTGHTQTWPSSELQVARTMVRLIHAGLKLHVAHNVARGHLDLAPGIHITIDPDQTPLPDAADLAQQADTWWQRQTAEATQ